MSAAHTETLFECVLSELRTLGSPGERLLRWVTQEFNQGRVQAWAEAVGADDAMVCAQAVAAAEALESQRQRHLPLPDWRAFTWDELLEWAADEDADQLPVWEERNVVYRFEDDWTLELVTTREDLFQESRLMRNCAGTTMPLTEPLLSLRDPKGRPHLNVKLQPSGRVVEIGGKAQGPIKSAYAARLKRAFEGHRIYYVEVDSWIPEPYKEDPLWGMDLFLDNRFLFAIFERDPWSGPDLFGVFDPRRKDENDAYLDALLVKGEPCHDCGIDTVAAGEYFYMLHDCVWLETGLRTHEGCLCIACCERRLGRRLAASDFQDVPLSTSPRFPRSARLRQRTSPGRDAQQSPSSTTGVGLDKGATSSPQSQTTHP